MSPDTFHFLRPYSLLMLIPLLALIALYGRRAQDMGRSAWHKIVDPHLLAHLAVKASDNKQSTWRLLALSIALLASIVALAGPTWQRNELPAFASEAPTVLVLSLAQSMNATDLSPNRLTRAGHKVRDFLDQAKGSEYGLVIYADQPFVAAPLTSDVRVITQMLGELSTNLMPVLGNRLELAIDKATDLLRTVGARQGRIVVIADDAGIDPGAAIASARAANAAGYRLSVLGVGTEQGANLQTASGRSFKTRDGKLAMTRLAASDLGEVADARGGKFITLSADNADIDALTRDRGVEAALTQGARSEFRADAWQDMGYWLLIIPILLAPLAFRKNVLMVLPVGMVIALSGPAQEARAASWDGLWQTPDQQGAQAFDKGDFDAATKAFEQPQWKASALYKAQKFGEAAQLYAHAESANDYYNLGNARAKAGELEQALAAYDVALKQEPKDADITFNRELVAKLLEEKKRKQQEQKNEQDKQQQGGGQQEQKQNQGQGGGKQDQAHGGGKQDQAHGGGKQDQAHGGGKQDQAHGGGKQDQAHGGGKQDQAHGGGKQDQAHGGGKQDQAQGGGKQDQAQDGGRQRQAQTGRENDQGQNGNGHQGSAEQASNPATQAPAVGDGGKSAFQQAMDALLSGNGSGKKDAESQQPAAQAATNSGLSGLDQAHEQKLRAVPDDPSGLLRARIRQHYAQRRTGG